MRKGIYFLIIGIVLITSLIVYSTKQAFTITNNDKALKESSSSPAATIEKNKSTNHDITGRWVWEENSKANTFTVDIIKVDNYYIGTYFAVAESGMKIDGDVEDIPSFKIENFNNKEVIVTFETYFSGTKGKAKLRFENDNMYWEIIEKPKGEYYCPNFAVLKRFIE